MRDTYNLLMALLVFAGVALYAELAVAQPATEPAPADLGVEDDDSAEEGPEDVVGEILDGVEEVPEAIDTIKEAKGDKMAMFMAICGLIAIVLKIVLSVFKLIPVAFFKNKVFLKIFPLAVGLAIFLVAHFAAGEVWYSALILAAGGPGAILFHEIWKLLPIGQDKKE